MSKQVAINDIVQYVVWLSMPAVKATVTAVRDGEMVDLVVFPYAGEINTSNHTMVPHDEGGKPALGTWHW